MMDDVVRLCDICGDEGWEDRLAICNKCTDGAEHIYCMDDMLDEVPEGWMCEDCKKSECQKSKSPRKNRDTVSSWALDLNVNPQDGIDMVGIDEFDAMDTRSSGDTVLLGGGDNYNPGCSDWRQFLDGKMETPESVLDLNISVRPESAAPEVDPCLSVGNVGDKPSKDVKGKMPMEENNDADNVKLCGKLPMDEKNNADRPESSTKPSLSFASPTSYEENLNLLHWQAAETLSSLLWIKKNLGLEWRRNNSS